jgi:hypothetical protein
MNQMILYGLIGAFLGGGLRHRTRLEVMVAKNRR